MFLDSDLIKILVQLDLDCNVIKVKVLSLLSLSGLVMVTTDWY